MACFQQMSFANAFTFQEKAGGVDVFLQDTHKLYNRLLKVLRLS